MPHEIMVTGTGTAVGNHIAKYLSNTKFNLIATYNQNRPKNLNNCKLIKIDLSKKIKKKINFDYIIHCASKIPRDGQNLENYRQNIIFMKNLLKLVNINKCKRIIFLSAVSLYGKPLVKKIDEKSLPLKPKNYGKSKLACEKEIIKFSKRSGLKYTILRLPAIIGHNIKNNFISNIFEKIKNDKIIEVYNINQKFNNVIHINILSEIIYKIIVREKKNSIYLLGSKYPIKIKTIIKMIKDKFPKKVKFNILKNKKINFTLNIKSIIENKYRIISTKETIKKEILNLIKNKKNA